MKFWDSSAIVALLIEQGASARAREIWKESSDSVVVWWGTSIECISALCRLARANDIGEEILNDAASALNTLSNVWHEVQPSTTLRTKAIRLLRVHTLRAQDSQQLAAALITSEDLSTPVSFVCFDQRLNEAARREGLEVSGL